MQAHRRTLRKTAKRRDPTAPPQLPGSAPRIPPARAHLTSRRASAPCPRPPSQTNPRRKQSLKQQGYLSRRADCHKALPTNRQLTLTAPLRRAGPARCDPSLSHGDKDTSCAPRSHRRQPGPTSNMVDRLWGNCRMGFSCANYWVHLGGKVLGVPGTDSLQQNLCWMPVPLLPSCPQPQGRPCVGAEGGRAPPRLWLQPPSASGSPVAEGSKRLPHGVVALQWPWRWRGACASVKGWQTPGQTGASWSITQK